MRILKGLAIRLANKLAPKPAPVVRTTDSILEDITEKVALLHVFGQRGLLPQGRLRQELEPGEAERRVQQRSAQPAAQDRKVSVHAGL